MVMGLEVEKMMKNAVLTIKDTENRDFTRNTMDF